MTFEEMCEEQGRNMKANEATVQQWTDQMKRIEAKLDRTEAKLDQLLAIHAEHANP